MIHRRILATAAVLALLVTAPVAFGQEARKYYRVDTVTVSEVNPDQHVLTATDLDGTSHTFVVDARTEVKEGADVIALEDLEKGDRVAVNARAPLPDVEGHPAVAESILVVNEDGDS